MQRPGSGQEPDRGQAIPVLLVVVALAACCAAGAAALGERLVARAATQAAADAAALAGVLHGRAAAQAVAERNGARLVEWSATTGEAADTVEVAVTDDGRPPTTAVARASTAP